MFSQQIPIRYYVDVKYGQHLHNTLDFWLVDSSIPTPLVVFYHGGAFVGGDKGDYATEHLTGFLRAGVSFAAVNYRYYTEHPQGVLGSIDDCRRALQWIRHKAPQCNIDKDRVGAYGTSAGAGTSLWIAFHDDMADANNNEPYLRESTRLQVVGAFATQATYDMMQWSEIFQDCQMDRDLKEALLVYTLGCYKLHDARDLYGPTGIQIRTALDFLAEMSPDDPPMYVRNGMANKCSHIPDMNHILHSPLHAKRLKEQADTVGLQCYVEAPDVGEDPQPPQDLVSFFLDHL
jgi:acetyl esterase/lipase